MNYIEQFKKDNRIKDNEHLFIENSSGEISEVYFKGNSLYIVDNIYTQEYLLLSLLIGERKISSRCISELEYELLKFWESKGFDEFKTNKGKKYIHKQTNGNWYLISQSLFNDLFKFSDEFNINDVLENCRVKS